MRHTLRSVRTSFVVATLVVLAGCAGEASDDGGSETVEVAEADVSFELPSGWLKLDPDEALAAATDKEVMAKLQQRFGPDPDTLGPVLAFIMDASFLVDRSPILVAAVPGLEDGHLTRFTMQTLDGDDRYTMEEIEESHRTAGGYPLAYLDVTEIDTEVGPAILAGVSMEIPDPPAMHWASIYVDTGPTQLMFTISTADRETSEQIALDFADSLQPLT